MKFCSSPPLSTIHTHDDPTHRRSSVLFEREVVRRWKMIVLHLDALESRWKWIAFWLLITCSFTRFFSYPAGIRVVYFDDVSPPPSTSSSSSSFPGYFSYCARCLRRLDSVSYVQVNKSVVPAWPGPHRPMTSIASQMSSALIFYSHGAFFFFSSLLTVRLLLLEMKSYLPDPPSSKWYAPGRKNPLPESRWKLPGNKKIRYC